MSTPAVESVAEVDPAADTAPVAANTPNPAFVVEAVVVAAPSLVVGNNPDFPTDTTVGIPLPWLPVQGHTPHPAATPVRNCRRTPHREAEVPRIRDIRTAPEPWLRSGLRRTLCKRQHLPSPPHRIPGKTIASALLHRPVGRRTPRKIPLRAGWGCRSWHRPVPPADALPARHSYRKTPSLLKFPVHIPGNAYEPPVGMAADDNRLPVSIYAKTVISAALCHKV